MFLSILDITNNSDKQTIIDLWSNRGLNSDENTRVFPCGFAECNNLNCNYSHFKMRGIAVTRCIQCNLQNCGRDVIKYRANIYKGKEVVAYVVCRRIAWELEDAKRKVQELAYTSDNNNIYEIKCILTDSFDSDMVLAPARKISTRIESNDPHGTLTKATSIMVLPEVKLADPRLSKFGIKAETQNLSKPENQKATSSNKLATAKPLVSKKRSNEDGGVEIYYIGVTPSNKRSITALVNNSNFRGQIRVSEAELQNIMTTLPVEDILNLSPVFEMMPGGPNMIELARLRIENNQLHQILNSHSGKP